MMENVKMRICTGCGARLADEEATKVSGMFWCAPCAMIRLRKGDRLDNYHLPFLIAFVLMYPLAFMILGIVVLAGGGRWFPPAVLLGCTFLGAYIFINQFLAGARLPWKHWLPAGEAGEVQRMDYDRMLFAVEQARKEGKSQREIARLKELSGLMPAEVEVLMKYRTEAYCLEHQPNQFA